MRINTTKAIAERLGRSVRVVQLQIKKLGIEPTEAIGKTPIFSDPDVKRLEKYKPKPGPIKGKPK